MALPTPSRDHRDKVLKEEEPLETSWCQGTSTRCCEGSEGGAPEVTGAPPRTRRPSPAEEQNSRPPTPHGRRGAGPWYQSGKVGGPHAGVGGGPSPDCQVSRVSLPSTSDEYGGNFSKIFILERGWH